jgi:hypothetical protein
MTDKTPADAGAAIQQKIRELSEERTRNDLGIVMHQIELAILRANESSPSAVRRALGHMDEAKKLLGKVLVSFGKNLG